MSEHTEVETQDAETQDVGNPRSGKPKKSETENNVLLINFKKPNIISIRRKKYDSTENNINDNYKVVINQLKQIIN